jgi:hypothetical protein
LFYSNCVLDVAFLFADNDLDLDVIIESSDDIDHVFWDAELGKDMKE